MFIVFNFNFLFSASEFFLFISDAGEQIEFDNNEKFYFI